MIPLKYFSSYITIKKTSISVLFQLKYFKLRYLYFSLEIICKKINY